MKRLTSPSAPQSVRGFLTIHSSPSALRRHIDWALQNILGSEVQVSWQPQPMMVGTYKMHIEWRGQQGAAAEIASTLRSWHYLNFETHESNDNGGELFRFTPVAKPYSLALSIKLPINCFVVAPCMLYYSSITVVFFLL